MPDRVTLVVRCTLALLLLIGVLAVFGDSLLGLTAEVPATAPGAPTMVNPGTPTPAPVAP